MRFFCRALRPLNNLRPARPFVLGFCLLAGTVAVDLRAQPPAASPPSLGVGAVFPTLQAGDVTYYDVHVRAVTIRSLIVLHRGGLGSIPLRTLSPDLQKAFGYSPAAEALADAQPPVPTPSPAPAPRPRLTPRESTKFDALLRHFGQPPEILPEVDLRPRFTALGLYAKNQGRRPSCAVFAVVGALEFQNAELLGHPEKLSEEYLIWACRKLLGRVPPADAPAPSADAEKDEGFVITDVVAALRAYGIPSEDSMPDTLGKKMSDIPEPAPELIDEARRHCHVAIYPVPRADLIANLIQSLNAGIPVVAGVHWPGYVPPQTGYLSQSQPLRFGNDGHAITIVGYQCPSGSIDKTLFIFKNSWGVHWGAAGYGQATAAYLKANLHEALVLELQPAPAR